MATRRAKKRRNRVGTALLQGAGIYFVGYFPALSWGNPMIAMGMISLMMILVAMRLKSVRAGFIRGLILGTLAGMAIWGGLDQRLKLTIAAREAAAQPPQAAPAEGDDEGSDASADHTGDSSAAETSDLSSGDEGDASAANDQAADQADGEAREVVPFTQEDRDYYEAIRRGLPYRAIPPSMVVCPVIGMVFAHQARKRRSRASSMWE